MKNNNWTNVKKLICNSKRLFAQYLLSTLLVASRNYMITYLLASISRYVILSIESGSIYVLQEKLFSYFLFLLSFLIVDSFSLYLQKTTVHRIGNETRKLAISSVLHAKINALDQIGNSAEIISRLNSDVQLLTTTLETRLLLPLMYIISGIGAIISISVIDYTYVIIIIFSAIILASADILLSIFIKNTRKVCQEKKAELANRFEESLRLSAPIKMMNLSVLAKQKFRQSMDEYSRYTNKLALLSGFVASVTSFSSLAQSVGVIIVGIVFFEMGSIGIEDIVYISEFAPLIVTMITSIGNSFAALQSSMASFERIFELIDLPQETATYSSINAIEGSLLLDVNAASLCFPDGNYAYKNLSLKIPDNSIIGIQGVSGSGKTSFVKTILRFYNNTSGEIKFLGNDIKKYSLSYLRNNITYIPQENLLHSGDIIENLYLDPDYDAGQIDNVLASVGAFEWIHERGGITTNIKSKTDMISGGQRQMIAFARAFLRPARLLIIDEAFANLDTYHIVKIMNYLKKQKNAKAIIIISHDKTVLDMCEKVFKL